MTKGYRAMPQGYYKLRYEIMLRDKFTCQACGQQAPNVPLEVDHRIEVMNGGTNHKDNLVTLCWACNRGKEGLRASMMARANTKSRIPLVNTIPKVRKKFLKEQLYDLMKEKPGLKCRDYASVLNRTESCLRVIFKRLRDSNMAMAEKHLWYAK